VVPGHRQRRERRRRSPGESFERVSAAPTSPDGDGERGGADGEVQGASQRVATTDETGDHRCDAGIPMIDDHGIRA
jgi:hypothetical protein